MTRFFHLDTNILLRFFTGQPQDQFNAASALFQRASLEEDTFLIVHPLVLAETAFTLQSFYKIPRRTVAGILYKFILSPGILMTDRELVLDALKRVQETGVHLVDAFLAAESARSGHPVASFDKDLDKFADISRYLPPDSH